MSLMDTISNDIKNAMLAREKDKLEALRAIKAALLLLKTEKDAPAEISEEKEISLLKKLVKQRKESAEIYKANNREDLYIKEIFEAEVIGKYLPAQIPDEELVKILKDIIIQSGAKAPSDMGKVMGIASKQLAGKADNKAIAEKVKILLGS